MTTDYLPKKEADLGTWINNFVTVATANITLLGYAPTDLSNLSTDNSTFTGDLAQLVVARDAMKSITQSKDTARKKATADVRALVRRAQSNPNVTPALKSSLGLNPKSVKPGPVMPITPDSLVATGLSNGVNEVSWSRNGNHPSTVFLLEAQVGTGQFVQVAGVTATKFTHENQTPGVEVTYRVRARRRTVISPPSTTATVYKTGTMGGTLVLSKAA